MNNYELLYIIDNSIEEEAREAVIEKLNNVVTGLNGTIENVDKWGTRKLAYPINYKSEGYYVLVNFQAEATVPAELERIMRITDAVVRYMIIVK
ncbi:MAG: 30S ribosomal protein S6 [Clostridia bacterium]|nr:30S ribosomal protein S6 [Clostridia bacterium]